MKFLTSSPIAIRTTFVIGIIGVLAVMVPGVFGFSHQTEAASTDNVSGYAWSGGSNGGPGIGWISFNCTNDGSCATSPYGVNIDSTGLLSGYAWADPRDATASSDNIGWIDFNSADLTGCPGGACEARVDPTTGKMTGWARVSVATTDPQAAWDGWISLSGTANDGSSYGVSVDLSTGKFSGYAWGDVVGWIDFSAGGFPSGVNVSPLPFGNNAALSAPNCVIASGASTCSTPFTWTITGAILPSLYNLTTLTTYSSATSGTSQPFNITNGSNTVEALDGATVLSSIVVTGTCTAGTAWNGTKCIPASAPNLSITAAPNRVQTNATSVISWNATSVVSCSVSGPSGSLASGDADASNSFSGASAPQTITGQETFTITCVGTDSSSASKSVIVNVVPAFQEF